MSRIRCRCCGGIAESGFRHDYKEVPNCPNQSVIDGGNDYLRLGGIDLSLIEVEDPPNSGKFKIPQ